MKIPLSILKKYLKTEKNDFEISEKLTSIGLEVELVEKRNDLDDFVVAKILRFEKHPDADKLNVCQVDCGNGEVLQIVCGAGNVRHGMKTILAKIGTVIPNGKFEIKKAKLRGVDSCGMLCSYDELLINLKQDGIAELPDDFQIGEKVAKLLNLNDAVIEISLTPNRGDCASVIGVARDLSACEFGEFLPYLNENKFVKNSDLIGDVCDKSMISILKIENVTSKKSSLKDLLDIEKFGLNSKNSIVDATNLAMFELGVPMHAYDADKIVGKISVKILEKPCDFIDLKGEKRALVEGDLVVCDDEKIIALAGIIGSLDSSVDDFTKNILLESANFDKDRITKTGQRLKINTDARFRFERGVDYNFLIKAIDFASQFICKSIEFAKISSFDIVEFKKNDIVINYSDSIFKKVIGFDVSFEKQIEIFEKLGIKTINKNANSIEVLVPSFRGDLENEKDLVEEVFRIMGSDEVDNTPLSFLQKKSTKFDKLWECQMSIRNLACGFGYDEVVTMSFLKKDDVEKICYDGFTKTEVFNPISSFNDTMRGSILPGLMSILSKENLKTRDEFINLFEIGSVFKEGGVISKNLAAISSKGYFVNDFRKKNDKFDFFTIKSHLFSILSLIYGDLSDVLFEPLNLCFAHKYKSFYVVKNGKKIASIGQFSSLIDNFPAQEVYFFEIFEIENVLSLFKKEKKIEQDLQNFIREFSFIVNKKINIGDFLLKLKNSNKFILSVDLIDIFESEKWENELSLSLSFQVLNKNTDIEKISSEIINLAASLFDAKLRDGDVLKNN